MENLVQQTVNIHVPDQASIVGTAMQEPMDVGTHFIQGSQQSAEVVMENVVLSKAQTKPLP
jgi:hypothetical protein